MRNSTRFLGSALVLLPTLISLTNYLSDVRQRSFARVWDTEISTEDDGAYTAKYAYLGRDTVLLRIYRSSDKKLLAERTFEYPDRVKLYWFKNDLLYHTNDPSYLHEGTISLPPGPIDNILAWLP